MFCGWEGNRRSGVALAMVTDSWSIHLYGLKGQCAGDEHPTYALRFTGLWSPLNSKQ